MMNRHDNEIALLCRRANAVGVSNNAICRHFGFTKTSLCNWLSGRFSPRFDVYQQLQTLVVDAEHGKYNPATNTRKPRTSRLTIPLHRHGPLLPRAQAEMGPEPFPLVKIGTADAGLRSEGRQYGET